MPLSDFEMEYPSLVSALKEKGTLISTPFWFHVTKGMNVERVAIIDLPNAKAPTEAHPKSKMANYARIVHSHKREYSLQKRLFEKKV